MANPYNQIKSEHSLLLSPFHCFSQSRRAAWGYVCDTHTHTHMVAPRQPTALAPGGGAKAGSGKAQENQNQRSIMATRRPRWRGSWTILLKQKYRDLDYNLCSPPENAIVVILMCTVLLYHVDECVARYSLCPANFSCLYCINVLWYFEPLTCLSNCSVTIQLCSYHVVIVPFHNSF